MTSLKSVVPNVATASAAFGDLSADQQAEIWSTRQNSASAQGRNAGLAEHTGRCGVRGLCPADSRFGWRGCRCLWPKSGSASRSGEIAFFAGGLRTATVVAVRDSVVLETRSRLVRETLRAACPPSTTNCSRPWHNGLPRPPRASRAAAASQRRARSPSSQLGTAAFLPRSLIACAVPLRARDGVFSSATRTSKGAFQICSWRTRPS